MKRLLLGLFALALIGTPIAVLAQAAGNGSGFSPGSASLTTSITSTTPAVGNLTPTLVLPPGMSTCAFTVQGATGTVWSYTPVYTTDGSTPTASSPVLALSRGASLASTATGGSGAGTYTAVLNAPATDVALLVNGLPTSGSQAVTYTCSSTISSNPSNQIASGTTNIGTSWTAPLSQVLTLFGQSTCSVQTSGTGVGWSLQPDVSATVGGTPSTPIGNPITTNTITTVPLNMSATAFALAVTPPTSGTLTVSYNCSNAITTGPAVQTITTVNNTTGTASLAALGASAQVSLTGGQGSCSVEVPSISSGMQLTAQFSLDASGANWYTAQGIGSNGIISAAGGYVGGCAGQLFRVVVSSFSTGNTASVVVNSSVASIPLAPNICSTGPCSVQAADKSVVINLSAAGKATLVTGTTSATIYVTGWNFSLNATTLPTAVFGYAPTGTCTTATPTPITGTYSPINGTVLTYGGTVGQALSVAPTYDLCITLAAGSGTPSAQGVLTYNQH